MAKLSRDFYAQPTLEVARHLLGQRLVRQLDGQRLSGLITETEAYMGPTDVASHAKHGPASRAAPMFGEPGHAYVYFTYGMYHCFNTVTEAVGSGTGVLIRAIEPTEGIATMQRLRQLSETVIPEHKLTNGPGKLCQALAITRELNGVDLLGSELWIEQAEPIVDEAARQTARVGISQGREHQWRFYIANSRFISAHPKY